MTDANKPLESFNAAFWTALLLAGNSDIAAAAVLEGIAKAGRNPCIGNGLLMETVKSAIHRGDEFEQNVNAASSLVPAELRRVAMLTSRLRYCFVLRILLGVSRRTCIELLHLEVDEFEDALRRSLESLALPASGLPNDSGGMYGH